MTAELNVIGIEIVVADIDRGISFFTEVFGWEVAHRGPAGHAPGEVAVLDGGSIAITLFEPAVDRTNAVADATPRITQLIVGADPVSVRDVESCIIDAGLPLDRAAGGSFIPPPAVAGILGSEFALSLRSIDGDDGARR